MTKTEQIQKLIEQATTEWGNQGRSEEQLYGVANFFSGRGIKLVEDLLAEQREEMFIKGYKAGNDRQIDWDRLEKVEQDAILSIIKK